MTIKLIGLKKTLVNILYKTALVFSKFASHSPKNNSSLLLIKNDEIGDYFLFRDFLIDIRNSDKYKNHRITLLGNKLFKQLFDAFDAPYVDDVIWIDKTKFKKDLSYRYFLLKLVRKRGFGEVVNCIYSRSILNDDCFAEVVSCDKKTAFASSSDSKLYTHYIQAGAVVQFDLLRNKTFFSKLLDQQENEVKASVFIDGVKDNAVANKYCVVFAGAGKQSKLWPASYFAEIITYIKSNSSLNIYLCGGPGDVKDSEAVKALISCDVHDETGKKTIPESLSILKDAEFMISVDTGAVHMGASVQCPVIGLYSGRDYGRFAPYPKEIFDKFYSIFSDNVDKVVNENYGELNNQELFPFEEIQKITPQKVIPYIDLLLSK